ncbi:MAG: hypothetical protein ACI9H6_000547 [Patiriisocius sp.]|jgi:hypothetical protein
MIEANYLIILACTVFGVALGTLWYGPLFGKQWCKLNGVDPNNKVEVARMKKGMAPVMLLQFLLTLFQVYVLFFYIKGAEAEMDGVTNALWLWAGFVVPTLAASVLWTNESKKQQKKRFLLQAGFNLVSFVAFALIIVQWG